MAFIRKQEGYYVEYLYPNGTSRFQEHNAHRDEAMECARRTEYVTRVWKADACAVDTELLHSDKGARFQVDTIVFLINPHLIYENINHKLFEV